MTHSPTPANGVNFKLKEPAKSAILSLDLSVDRVVYDALNLKANTRQLALLKRACQAFLELPLIQALSTENLPDD